MIRLNLHREESQTTNPRHLYHNLRSLAFTTVASIFFPTARDDSIVIFGSVNLDSKDTFLMGLILLVIVLF
jgi:hypothetical protein